MTDDLRLRDGDQPLPTANSRRDVMALVAADVMHRREVGISRYGTTLQAFNGRNPLRDLYEELLDAAAYVRQLLEEADTCECCGGAIDDGTCGGCGCPKKPMRSHVSTEDGSTSVTTPPAESRQSRPRRRNV